MTWRWEWFFHFFMLQMSSVRELTRSWCTPAKKEKLEFATKNRKIKVGGVVSEWVSQHFSGDNVFWKLPWSRYSSSVLLGKKIYSCCCSSFCSNTTTHPEYEYSLLTSSSSSKPNTDWWVATLLLLLFSRLWSEMTDSLSRQAVQAITFSLLGGTTTARGYSWHLYWAHFLSHIILSDGTRVIGFCVFHHQAFLGCKQITKYEASPEFSLFCCVLLWWLLLILGNEL